ncbi:RHOMBOID-like protein 10, chloroplastic isoform X1 [Senna tora]|uniref:RHOMBOID-like protein 10, chloroplastic isoform X1 n=1 Tax=Senna tora TaxID=362788 RepID=A0A834SHG6_9FABA|nr:RHOMBOID-like protein 10, chloroplastic isoform X1 [Senna tora]
MARSAVPHPFFLPISKAASNPLDLIATAASLHFTHLLRRRVAYHFRLGILLQSCFKRLPPLNHVIRLKDVWCERALQLKEINFLQLSYDVSTSFSTGFSFFNGGEHRARLGNDGMSNSKMSNRNPLSRRKWTNILLAANILLFIAQLATQGKLLLWGAKINSLIDKGQLWRLATSSFLHANIGHLMVNCYSLNSIGPTVESFSGPTRYLAVYSVSALASSAMSYWFCRMPAVGASGAIFGLVGSLAVFVLRHRELVGGGKEDLQHIAHILVLNMVIGLLSDGIDNWGHLGGLMGGAAASWFIGPAWKYESTTRDGRRVFTDKAPIYNIFNIKRLPRQLK